jgi:prepilin-type N-terminal cleavage/methylation domain-containing protein
MNPHAPTRATPHSAFRIPHSHRSGFTLVELLIVIVIIGMLVALVSYAAAGAMKTAKQGAITFELNELNRGLLAYKDERGAYPPCFASDPANAVQQARIMRHLSTAFPRYRSDANGNGVFNEYADFRQEVLTATIDPVFPSGRDINNLDQGEALVFWLGGLPSRFTDANQTGTTAGKHLIGFAKDQLRPFQHEDAMTGQPQRTDQFPFDPSRLFDSDNDGWYEYVPKGVQLVAATPAPYVYFDATSYKGWYPPASPGPPGTTVNVPIFAYPSTAVTPNRGLGTNAVLWGAAWPMWEDAPTGTNQAAWEQPDAFQIICCGLDGMYSGSGGTAATGPVTFPDVPDDAAGVIDFQPILDNLTSFSESTIQTEREKHSQ